MANPSHRAAKHTDPPLTPTGDNMKQPYNATVQLLPLQTSADNIAATIQASARTIDAMIYLVTAPPPHVTPPHARIVAALAQASIAGKRVRCILPAHDMRGPLQPTNDWFLTRADASGMDIRFSPRNNLQHAKMFIVDGHVTFHLTSNLTHAAFTKNSEVNVMVAGELHAWKCTQAFNDLWATSMPRHAREVTE
jgi:phosphatidylserine/phosphatidylglycerophosphate/cardiolipin synthase-like enzyme